MTAGAVYIYEFGVGYQSNTAGRGDPSPTVTAYLTIVGEAFRLPLAVF